MFLILIEIALGQAENGVVPTAGSLLPYILLIRVLFMIAAGLGTFPRTKIL